MIELSTPIEELTRVGKSTASRLKRLGIFTARDLLFHFPHRYEDWSQRAKIAEIRPNQNISIKATVASIRNFTSPRKRMKLTEALVEDETGQVKVLWFNQPFLLKNLPTGTKVSLAGKAEINGKELLLKSPKYEVLNDQEETAFTGRILPIYPLSLNLTQKQMQFLVSHVLPLAAEIEDPLPESIRAENQLPHLSTALRFIHEPSSMDQVESAQKRFAFEEVFYLQLQSAYLKQLNKKTPAPPLRFFENEMKDFVDALPFVLTTDQRKAAWAIFLDLQEPHSMNRLLQGDVGSGKTVIAAMAAYNVFLNKKQSVFMAPTEVLAHQHFQNLLNLFAPYDLSVALLTRTQHALAKNGKKEYFSKQKLIQKFALGEADLILGTHALIQEEVSFQDLGLAIIDEQHRFGVKQRKTIKNHSGDRKTIPHLLSMTATPIPRTLSLIFYGDLAVSSIRELPKNRLPIQTNLILEKDRMQAYAFVNKNIEQGDQAFVICPLIEESDSLGVKSVTEEEKSLKKHFPGRTIATLHGKMKSAEKEEIMHAYKNREIDLLVATTVIEVGIDIQNATMMLIEGAERFGLSQLHQIRGRVGRGKKQSYCFLFPTDEHPGILNRLNRFIQCRNGFDVSELDLQIRGSGELLGTRQSGQIELQFVDITDTDFIEMVYKAVKSFLQNHLLQDFPLLRTKIEKMNEQVHLE